MAAAHAMDHDAPADIGTGTVDIVIPVRPDETGVRAAMQSLTGALDSHGHDADCQSTIEIAVTEALNNIVEHAFAAAARPVAAPAIRLRCRLGPSTVTLRIVDNGAALPGGTLPEGAAHDLDVAQDDLPEGGFGWFLIRTLARDVRYRRRHGCNALVLDFDVAMAAGQP